MMKKWIVINLLLLAAAGALGWRIHKSVLRFNAANNLSKIQPVKDIKQKMPQQTALKPAPIKAYNPADFAVISDKNLFSDLRAKEEKPPVNVAPPEPPPLAQKPILVGITISGDQQFASIIDPTAPAQTQNQRRRAQIKRIGDSYSGYVITEITMDRIVLQSGTRKEIIPLHEGTKRAQAGKTPVQATRVVSFGGGGTGGKAAVVVSGTAVPMASTPVRPATSTASITAAGPATPQPTPAAGSTQQAQPAQTPARTRVIKTPFGDVVRPVD